MIEAAYMTGILPIKKYGTQSAMTDFREYTMTAPKKLAEFVGFTEQEVRQLCTDYHMDFSEFRKWYDGYSFNRVKSVYNPNSVIEAIRNEEIDNYWTQSETYESLRLYIEMNEDGLKEAIIQMLGGAKIKIDTATFQNDMTTIRCRDDVLTLLVHLGYLAYDIKNRSVSIPNEEVRQEFVRAVTTGKHTEIANLIRGSDHSVIRVAYISCIDEYLRIDELPSGHGYADVVFFPKKASALPLLLVELKWNKTEKSAIRQIKEKDYPQILKDYGGDILLVGINYDAKSKKHTCEIEKYQLNSKSGGL